MTDLIVEQLQGLILTLEQNNKGRQNLPLNNNSQKTLIKTNKPAVINNT